MPLRLCSRAPRTSSAPRGLAPFLRQLDLRLPERYWPVSEAASLAHVGRRAGGDHVAAVFASPRAEVDEVVGGHHRVLIVLDH